MKAYKCDSCKQYADEHNGRSAMTIVQHAPTNHTHTIVEIDLCEKCRDRLLRYIYPDDNIDPRTGERP